MNANTTAENAYADRHAECTLLLKKISDALADRDAPSSRMNWGHVGDLTFLRSLLREVAEVLGVAE